MKPRIVAGDGYPVESELICLCHDGIGFRCGIRMLPILSGDGLQVEGAEPQAVSLEG